MTVETVESFRGFSSFLCNQFPGGVVFGQSDREKMIWKMASTSFDIPTLYVGGKVREGGASYQCMLTKEVTQEKVPRNIYGTRLLMTCIPIFDGDTVVGSWAVILPREHPVAKAFNSFAPLIAEMFPEGAFLYISDLDKIVYRQASRKFDMPQFQAGTVLDEQTIIKRSMKAKEPMNKDLDAKVYGVPAMILNYPLFDEDDPNTVIGSFGIAIPRANQAKLRNVSNNLERGLVEIAAVLEQLASSASQVSSNEQQLNQNIKEIFQLSEDINVVLSFIKQIADETKMLGLNAAIEAARAGEAGRGFGVVAGEIRKLSDESKDTVTKIHGLTDRIKEKIEETTNNSYLTIRASEEQAAATQEINASVEEITSMAGELDRMAKEM